MSNGRAATSPPKRNFIWGWGRVNVNRVDRTPKLLEALESSSIRQITSANRQIVAVTNTGELYSWGEYGPHTIAAAPPTAALRAAAERLPASRRTRQFGQVSGLEKERIGFTVCARSHILAVAGSGNVYGWDVNADAPSQSSGTSTPSTTLNGEIALPSPLNVTKAPIDGGIPSTSLASGISSDVCQPGGALSAISLHHLPSVAAASLTSIPGSMLVSPNRLTIQTSASSTPTSVDQKDDTNNRALSSPVRSSNGSMSVATTPVHGQGHPIARLPRTLAGLVDLPIVKVACGVGFTLAVTRDGRLYSFGIGSHGRLGHGTCDNEPHPRLVQGLADIAVVGVAAGWAHTVCITDRGKVYSWGCGWSGRLGSGDTTDLHVPTMIASVSDQPVVDVACGYHHTLALDVLGNVFSWGGNEHGQLGVGDDVPRHIPTRVFIDDSGDDQEHVNRIACGPFHSAAVTLTGELAMWGNGEHGQLGLGNTDSHSTLPRLVDALSGMDVSLVTCGADYTVAVTDHFIVVQQDYFSRDPDQPVAYMPTRSGSISEDQPPTLGRREPVSTSSRSVSSATNRNDDDDYDDHKSHHKSNSDSINSNSADIAGVYSDESPRDRPPIASTHSAPSTSTPFGVSSTSSSAASSNGPPVAPRRGSLFGSMSMRKSATLPDLVGADNSLNGSATTNAATINAAKRKKSIFDMVRDALSSTSSSDRPSIPPATMSSISSSHSSLLSSTASIVSPGMHTSTSVPSSLSSSSNISSVPQSSSRPTTAVTSTPLFSSGFRPANLPPKSAAEVNKHKAEVNRMNEEYRKKLKREAEGKAMARQQEITRRHHEEKVRKAQMKKDIEREQKLDGAATFWIKFVVPHWESKKYWSKARDTVWKVGIPPRVRGQVWPLALGNSLMITEPLFDIFGKQALEAREKRKKEQAQMLRDAEVMNAGNAPPEVLASIEAKVAAAAAEEHSSKSKAGTFSHIDVDLTRTFPQLAFFQEDQAMNEQLRSVLDTYCFYRPDVGYVQGMSYLAGNFLLYMTPYNAFVCFANLLNSAFFHVFLKLDPSAMVLRYEIFNSLFQEYQPDLYNHFEEQGMKPDLYFMEWCMTLFCKRLKLDVVGRVWDCYLISGEAIVYRCAVGVLTCLRDKLIDQPFERVMKLLSTLPADITEQQLFDATTPIRLNQSLKEKLSALQTKTK